MNPFEIKVNIPFEDGVFIDFYRNILLRNVPFCEINSEEDLLSCRTLTIQFIQKAMRMAHGIHTKQFELLFVLNYFDKVVEKDKAFHFLYIMYRELFRKGHSSSQELLSILSKYPLNAPFTAYLTAQTIILLGTIYLPILLTLLFKVHCFQSCGIGIKRTF